MKEEKHITGKYILTAIIRLISPIIMNILVLYFVMERGVFITDNVIFNLSAFFISPFLISAITAFLIFYMTAKYSWLGVFLILGIALPWINTIFFGVFGFNDPCYDVDLEGWGFGLIWLFVDMFISFTLTLVVVFFAWLGDKLGKRRRVGNIPLN